MISDNKNILLNYEILKLLLNKKNILKTSISPNWDDKCLLFYLLYRYYIYLFYWMTRQINISKSNDLILFIGFIK